MHDTTPSFNALADYQTTIRVLANADSVFDALTTSSGLTAWWTRTEGSGEAGGELKFFMSFPDPMLMHVDEATRPTSVQWTVTACDFVPDWVGTRPTFTIVPIDVNATEIQFRHEGLTPDLDCIEDCTRGWNHFILTSLRDYVEGRGGSPRESEADLARRA